MLDENIFIMKKKDTKMSFDYVNKRFLKDFEKPISTLRINSEVQEQSQSCINQLLCCDCKEEELNS